MPVYGSRQRRRIASVSRRSGINEFATMVGGRGEIKKDVDFPEPVRTRRSATRRTNHRG